PFSLADLGLSEDEISTLEGNERPTTPAAPEAEPEIEMMPFSLAELGLSEDEISTLEGNERPTTPEAEAEPEIEVTPFSLADLGLSEDEIAGLESITPGISSQTGDELDMGELPADLQPFSMDELDLGATEAAGDDIGEMPSSLQPFSLEDTRQPPERPRMSGLASEETIDSLLEEEPLPSPRGFSWQQPTQRPEPGFVSSMRPTQEQEQGSIFDKLRQTRPPQPSDELPGTTPIAEDEHLGLFSLDNVSLRDDDDDLPLSAATPTPAAPTPEPEPEAAEVESVEEGLASGAIQPFSFADLGLSAEEIAALGLGGETPVPEPAARGEEPVAETPAPREEMPAVESFDFGLDDIERASPSVTQPLEVVDDLLPDTGELQPFSLADLGLSDEEIEELDLEQAYDDADDSRLGLTEEELAGLDQGGDVDWAKLNTEPAATPEELPVTNTEPPLVMSGDLVVDRLIALGREQGFVDIADIIAAVENPEKEAARIEEIGQRLHAASVEIRDGDEVIDMDAEYEDEELPKGPVFETLEPSATVAGEEMTPFSLHDLGLSDEEIAMLGLGSEQEQAQSSGVNNSLEPFSLDELGLTGGDVDSLDLADASLPPAMPAPPPEPSLEPFSLSDLGLTDEEIAMLGLSEVADAETTVPEARSTPPPEPSLEPFSLSDLGLTDEEIAMLGLSEAGSADLPADTERSAPLPEPAPRFEQPTPAPEPVSPAPPTEPRLEQATPTPPPPPTPEPAPRIEQQAAQPRPVAPRAAQPAATGNEGLDHFLRQLDAEPQNHVLRLAMARASGQVGMGDVAVQQYRDLIKRGALLDDVIADLSDLIADSDDEQLLRRLHRILGDAYSKQGRFAEAVDAYSWTNGRPGATN
ncbi:MAG: hypothetical protein RLZZ387_1173, partial [Chloroflexota bacterium]